MSRTITRVPDSGSVVLAGDLDAVRTGHADVHDSDVRVQLLDQLHRLGAVPGLAHDFDIGPTARLRYLQVRASGLRVRCSRIGSVLSVSLYDTTSGTSPVRLPGSVVT